MSDLAARIEAYLDVARGWVSSEELCRVFGVNERALRAVGRQPGLCTAFAISGDKGYRHVAHASDAEFERFDARLGEHAIGELVRRMKLRRRRRELLAKKAPPVCTRDGQALLFQPGEHSAS